MTNGKAAAPKGVAATSKAKAAQKEKAPKPRQVTVRGRTFDLPAEQPFSVVLAARTARRAEREGDEEQATYAMLELAEAYVGARHLEGLVAGLSATDGANALNELLEKITEEYGTTPGESSASSSS